MAKLEAELSEELASRIKKEAKDAGLTVSDYISRILEKRSPSAGYLSDAPTDIDAWLQKFSDSHGQDLPVLEGHVLRREHMYEDEN